MESDAGDTTFTRGNPPPMPVAFGARGGRYTLAKRSGVPPSKLVGEGPPETPPPPLSQTCLHHEAIARG
jgi:hypothetical protein